MPRILVVEDSPVQAKHAEFILRAAGHAPDVVADGVAALDRVRTHPPDLVLTDIHTPRMGGLELTAALRRACPSLPVVVTTERGSEDLAVQALNGGAAGYVPKRHLARDLPPLIDEILAVTASQKSQAEFLTRLTAAEYTFELENDPDVTGQVVGQVEAVMRQMGLFDEAARMRVGMAVHEAAVNAIVHGNLEVSSDLKAGDWAVYLAEVKGRAGRPPYRDRRVTVTIRAARRPPSLEVRVRDQGRGYDPAALPDPTDPANLDLSCGRGLLLIRTFFDDVTHNAAGTEITMVKRGGAEG